MKNLRSWYSLCKAVLLMSARDNKPMHGATKKFWEDAYFTLKEFYMASVDPNPEKSIHLNDYAKGGYSSMKSGRRIKTSMRLERIEELLGEGYTMEDIAEDLDISVDYLKKICQDNEIHYTEDVDKTKRPTIAVERRIWDIIDFLSSHDVDGIKYCMPKLDMEHKIRINSEVLDMQHICGSHVIYDRQKQNLSYIKMKGEMLQAELDYLFRVIQESWKTFYDEAMSI